jgi:hypothetical protein
MHRGQVVLLDYMLHAMKSVHRHHRLLPLSRSCKGDGEALTISFAGSSSEYFGARAATRPIMPATPAAAASQVSACCARILYYTQQDY